jgi:hypothetical protein
VWQASRIVLSGSCVYFTDAGKEEVIDVVQLIDISNIELFEDSVSRSFSFTTHERKAEKGCDTCESGFQDWLFQIATIETGGNCGRIYRFRCFSKSDRTNLTHSIESRADHEKRISEKRSTFEICQEKVRIIFLSRTTQYLLAFLIMAVSFQKAKALDS